MFDRRDLPFSNSTTVHIGPATCININDPKAMWSYCPSFGAAIVFAILFSGALIAHSFQAFHLKKRFCWVIVMAAIWETAGFVFRIISTRQQQSSGPMTAQTLLILLAPIWINAYVYMVLGRMILYYLPSQHVFGVSARRLTLIFVLLDIISFLIQAVGGVLMSGTDVPHSQMELGIHIYMGGVGFQLFWIIVFLFLAARFHRHMTQIANPRQTSWLGLLIVVYVSLGLIGIRIVYRLIEFNSGPESFIPRHEFFVYVFEATPMFIVLVTYAIFHPGRFLLGPESEFPKKSKADKRAAKDAKALAKDEEKRNKVAGRWMRKGTKSGEERYEPYLQVHSRQPSDTGSAHGSNDGLVQGDDRV